MKYTYILLVISLFWMDAFSETCTTPLGRQSECITLYNCPPLVAAFDQRPLPSQTVQFLKLSQCGFQGYDPKVCCGPLPTSNQERATTQRPRPVLPTEPSRYNLDPVSSEDSYPASRDTCGIDDQDRIFGGTITDLDEFPWMALLGYRTRNGTLTYQCGGVLINRRYVLTAAHCVTGQVERDVGKLASVRLGEYDIQQDVDCLGRVCADRPQEIPVQATYPHTGFTDKSKDRRDDIALIRLARRARYSAYIQPICLMDARARLDAGHSVYVAGWGKTLNGRNSPVKLKLSMPIFDKNDCVNKYSPLGAHLGENQICAGGTFAQDTCRGDSGGPLMRRRSEGVWEVVGIVSFGNGCGRDGWPGVYTHVGGYIDWIQSTLRSTNV